MALDPKADPKSQATLALHRFGLGPRAGSVAAIASDPRGALIAELDRPNASRLATPELMTSRAAARAAVEFQIAQRQLRREANGKNAQQKNAQPKQAQPDNAEQKSAPQPNAPQQSPPQRQRATVGTPPQELYLIEAKARLDAALAADLG